MASYTLTPLNPTFRRRGSGIDLNAVTGDHLFPDIRALFEEHSALLFRGQTMTEETHRLAELFGRWRTVTPRTASRARRWKIPTVSNVEDDGGVRAARWTSRR
jgi:alpha-ketoglutarate-dependent 2,4-dichlorophenoxyacetate dioxygenase